MVQEEVENRTVNLAITTTKLSARAVLRGIMAFLAHRQRNKAYPKELHGKQSVKKLLRQPQSVTKMSLDDGNIKEFAKLAKRYGVDFAVTKDRSKHPPVYTIFFKAKDTEALQHIADTLVQRQMNRKNKKPSLLSQLAKLKEIVAKIPQKSRHRSREQSL